MNICQMCTHNGQKNKDDDFACDIKCDEYLEFVILPVYKSAPDMYEALKEVEYSAVLDLDGDFISCCPICDVWAGEKHKDYCEIGNALRKAEGRTD